MLDNLNQWVDDATEKRRIRIDQALQFFVFPSERNVDSILRKLAFLFLIVGNGHLFPVTTRARASGWTVVKWTATRS
jgi:hypothetical protein